MSNFLKISLLISGTLIAVFLDVFLVSDKATAAVSSNTRNTISCSDLYWIDNSDKNCQQKTFCGSYMYQGLQTFATQAECIAAVGTKSSSSLTSSVSTLNLNGYAWSDNIGWIDFAPVGGGVSSGYNNFISGYAWSDNIGWIKFGGLSDFPSGLGTVSQNAQIVSGKLVGWARVCTGSLEGICGTASRTDGWDGWISLDGTGYGITINDNRTLSGYAWGSDVVGWVNFSGVIIDVPAPITINLSASYSSVWKGASTTITWSSTGADFCSINKNNSAWDTGLSGSKNLPNMSTSTTFDVNCKNANNSANKSLTVDVMEKPKPSPTLNVTESEIEWNADEYTDACTLTVDGKIVSSQISGDIVDDSLQAGMPIVLECNGSGGTTVVKATSVAPAVRSICSYSQDGNTSGDMNIYVNKNVLWSVGLSLKGVTITNRSWSGTNISTTTGLTLNKIYTTVGLKTINAITTGKRADGSSFSSNCSSTISVKLDQGSNGEI